jgi:DNA-binding transcriptional MerR regulator
MHPSLPIGDFARATHLSVKTLRFYHQSGLLEPDEIDSNTGYRRYGIDQIPTAQVIRRFRELDMPLTDIRAVLLAPDVATRNDLIAAHLRRLEKGLARTRSTVTSLRELLEHPEASVTIAHRTVDETMSAAITEIVDVKDAMTWYQGALGELYATLSAQGREPSATAGGIFSNELFTDERGIATVFVPCRPSVQQMGRVTSLVVPAIELATTVHMGPHNGIDREYGALASYVAEHALAVAGPIREYYLVDRHDTANPDAWRTEVGWPIFATGAAL